MSARKREREHALLLLRVMWEGKGGCGRRNRIIHQWLDRSKAQVKGEVDKEEEGGRRWRFKKEAKT